MSKLDEFIAYLEGEVNQSLYVWGAQGESVKSIVREWVTKKETSEKNVDRAMKLLGKRMPFDFGFYDCSGLGVSWLLQRGLIKSDMSAANMYAICTQINKAQASRGDWVFIRSSNGAITHVGYMVASNYVIESAGRDVGVIKRPLAQGSPNGQWTHFGRPDKLFPELGKAQNPPEAVKPSIGRVLKLSTPMLKGDDVKALQTILDIKADGVYGNDTKAAVIKAQKRLFPSDQTQWDGAAGQKTIEGLGLKWIDCR